MNEYKTLRSRDVGLFLKDFAGFVKNMLRFVGKALRNNVWIVIISLLIFSGAGYFYSKTLQPFYESEMVCAYNFLHKKTFGEMVHRLDMLASGHSYEQLAKELNIPLSDAQSILSLKPRNVAGSPLYEDLTTEKTPLYFLVRTTERNVFPKLETALLNYLNGTRYQNKRIDLEKQKLEQRISMMQHSATEVDSVIKAYTLFLRHTQAVTDTAAGFSNIGSLFKYKEDLMERMLETQKGMALMQTVELLYGFAPPDKPVDNSSAFWIKLLALALITTLIIAVTKQALTNE